MNLSLSTAQISNKVSHFAGMSDVNNIEKNEVSFGMAKFTDKGYHLASLHSDIYDALSAPNENLPIDFFKPKKLFRKSPFTKYYIEKTASNDQNSINEVAQMIVNCGTGVNAVTNACFISQLLDTEKFIHSANSETKNIIGPAINEVLKKNWDNPELSKKDTFRLLELAQYGMDERAYVSLNGVIQASDMK